MGTVGPLFGVIFYLLVLIAAISSAVSLIEVISAFFLDNARQKGKELKRSKTVLWVVIVIAIEAIWVAIDGLGSNMFAWPATATWNDCALDFMDCWSEGIAMPLGAMLMGLMIGWELKNKPILDEISIGSPNGKAFVGFYKICIMIIVPIVMAFIFAGSIGDFFGNATAGYIIALALLVIFFIIALLGREKKTTA